MKKTLAYLIIQLIALFIIVILILLPFNMLRFKLYEQNLENAYNKDITDYCWVKSIENVNGFILGSSTLKYGLSSSELGDNNKKWINFSMGARDPIVFYLLLKTYAPLKNPKQVIVSLDPGIYSKKYYIWRNSIMLLDLNNKESTIHIKSKSDLFIKKLKTSIYFLMGKYQMISNTNINEAIIESKLEIPNDYGSAVLNKVANNFKEFNEDPFDLKKFSWSELEFEYLDKIKLYCRENNIELLFVIPPKRNDFVNYTKSKYSKQYEQWWSKIYEHIGREKLIGNLSCLSKYKQDSIFVEAFHLNKNGQILYSNYLKSNLNSYRFIEKNMDLF